MLVVPLGFWLNPSVLQERYCKVLIGQCHGIQPHWVAPNGHTPYEYSTKPGAPLPLKNGKWHQSMSEEVQKGGIHMLGTCNIL